MAAKPVRCGARCPQIAGALEIKICSIGKHKRYRYLFYHNAAKVDHCSDDCVKCRKATLKEAREARRKQMLTHMRILIARGYRCLDEFETKFTRAQSIWLLSILIKRNLIWRRQDGQYWPIKKVR